VSGVPVQPGQRRRTFSDYVVTVTAVGHDKCLVVFDGNSFEDARQIADVARWSIVEPLPPLPPARYSCVPLDGEFGMVGGDPLPKLVEWRAEQPHLRQDLFVEWTPRFVDRDGNPVEAQP
jgi:hypothetical protein